MLCFLLTTRTACCPQLSSFLSSGPSEPSPAPSRGDLDEVFIGMDRDGPGWIVNVWKARCILQFLTWTPRSLSYRFISLVRAIFGATRPSGVNASNGLKLLKIPQCDHGLDVRSLRDACSCPDLCLATEASEEASLCLGKTCWNGTWVGYRWYFFFFAGACQRICPTTMPPSWRRQGLPGERKRKWQT